jgi:hypothetical protein
MTVCVLNLVGVLGFIMTVTTVENLIAAWSSNSTTSPIMLATMLEFSNRQLVFLNRKVHGVVEVHGRCEVNGLVEVHGLQEVHLLGHG